MVYSLSHYKNAIPRCTHIYLSPFIHSINCIRIFCLLVERVIAKLCEHYAIPLHAVVENDTSDYAIYFLNDLKKPQGLDLKQKIKMRKLISTISTAFPYLQILIKI